MVVRVVETESKVKLTMRVVSQGGVVVFGGCDSQAGGVQYVEAVDFHSLKIGKLQQLS